MKSEPIRELDRRVRELLVAVGDPDADLGAAWSALEPHFATADELRKVIESAAPSDREVLRSEMRVLSELLAVTVAEAQRERLSALEALERVRTARQSFAFYGGDGDAAFDVAG